MEINRSVMAWANKTCKIKFALVMSVKNLVEEKNSGSDFLASSPIAMPMGQMPVLEVDGKRVHQSLAMCRYVAKQINLAGDNPLEALQIDAIVDTINDFRLKIAIVAYEPDDMVKEKKMITLNSEVIPFYLTKLNVIAKENNGHLVLGKPTWADVYFAGILDYLNYLTKTNLLENFPNLQEVVNKVLDNENIKAYIAKRPITETTFHRTSVSQRCLSTYTCKDGVGTILLDNEKTRNSLSLDMMASIHGHIASNQHNTELRCIVLAAQGRVFSAGHNLKELTAENGPDRHKQVFHKCSELIDAIRLAPVPIIAKVDGLAAAAGCQLVASCDMAVCSDTSTFSTPGASFGIFCSTPGIAVVRAIPRMRAAYMLFTGLPITAKEALEAGLVSKIVPKTQLDEEVDNICKAIASKSRAVIALGKTFFYKQIALDVSTAYELGEQIMVDNLATIDGREGIKSFVEKRPPRWSHKD
uniref:Enoyl-CoA hydratase domain-containing protein 3, mitochondrial n=1 Tax=Anopheles minimus TaxID=112268 RepID=A0A182W3P4_9DIPT